MESRKKPGDKATEQNYEPICLLSTCLLIIDVTVSINYTPGPIGSYLLKFNWSVTANNHSECATNVLTYILTSNCGICPSTTNNTNVTCNYSGNHSADGCMFTVKFVVCESQFQDTVTVNLLTSDGKWYYIYIIYTSHIIYHQHYYMIIQILCLTQYCYYLSSVLSAFFCYLLGLSVCSL